MNIQDGGMRKAAAMDKLMDCYDKGISSLDIMNIVNQVFQIDLEAIPDLPVLPQAAIDAYLEQSGNRVTGAELRKWMNQTFRVNLDALSILEGAKISLYSKNRWMLQHDKDLFAVFTGTGDVDVRIFPTAYFAEQTGSRELPLNLINALIPLGYYCEESWEAAYFSNPTGEPVSDAFKGQTMVTIRKFIMESYAHL